MHSLDYYLHASDVYWFSFLELKRIRKKRYIKQSRNLALDFKERKGNYNPPDLFINLYGDVKNELSFLSENQSDPVYDTDDVLNAIDFESIP